MLINDYRGVLGRLLGGLRGVLESLGVLGLAWGVLGGLGRGLGHSWVRLGRLLGELGGVLGGLGVLGWSWGIFGSVLARPGLRLGVVLGGSGGVLRAS